LLEGENQVATHSRLPDIAKGTSFKGGAADVWVLGYCKKNNLGVWVGFPQTLCYLDSIQDRHGNIQDHDIREQFGRSVQRCLTVTYRANDLATAAGQETTDILKHPLVVVG
jgi:membrane peptidoglycan carboxypeptidase